MEKSPAPFSLGGGSSIRGNDPLTNSNPSFLVHYRVIVIGSVVQRCISYDRNTVSNRFTF